MIHPQLEKMCAMERHKILVDDQDDSIFNYVQYRTKLTDLTFCVDAGELTVGEAMLEARL